MILPLSLLVRLDVVTRLEEITEMAKLEALADAVLEMPDLESFQRLL